MWRMPLHDPTEPSQGYDWRRHGFPRRQLDHACIVARLQQIGAGTTERMAATDTLADVAPLQLGFPPTIEGMLLRVLDHEASERAPEWQNRIEGLLLHYFELMPALRLGQTHQRVGPEASLFRAPLDWTQLPQLCAALDRLYDTLVDAGVDVLRALGHATAEAWRAEHHDLAEIHGRTYFGGLMPMIYGFPADCQALVAEVAAGASLCSVIDQRLTASVIHELSHLNAARTPLEPPYLDECISGYLGMNTHRATAFPAPNADNALFLAPWFSQLGQAIAGVVGLGPLLRAHAGAVTWDAVLPAGLVDLWAAWGWAQQCRTRATHFLGEVQRPGPWVKALYLALAGELPTDTHGATPSMLEIEAVSWASITVAGAITHDDIEALRDGLLGMCLRPSVEAGVYRVSLHPTEAAVDIDAVTGWITRDAPPHMAEPARFQVLVPPRIGRRLRNAGHPTVRLPAYSPEAVDALVEAVLTKAPCDGR